MTYLLIPYMALAYKLHGAGSFKGCRELSQAMLAAPYALAVYLSSHNPLMAFMAFTITGLSYDTGAADGFIGVTRNNPPTSTIAVPIANALKVERATLKYDLIFWTVKALIVSLATALMIHSLGSVMFVLTTIGAFIIGLMIMQYPKVIPYVAVVSDVVAGMVLGISLIFII